MADNNDIIPERVSARNSSTPTNNAGRASHVGRTSTASHSKEAKGIGGVWKLLIIMLLLVSLGLGYLIYIGQQTLKVLDMRLIALSDRLEEIENKLSVTDESLSQSGAAIQVILKDNKELIDKNLSEIRKLWAIAHQTNTKNIANNKKAINLLDTKFDSKVKALSEMSDKINTSLTGLNNNITAISDSSVANSAAIEFIEEQLRDMTDLNNSLKITLQSQQQKMDVTDEQLEAINESRKQVNRRILDMQKSITSLSATLSSLKSALKSAPKPASTVSSSTVATSATSTSTAHPHN